MKKEDKKVLVNFANSLEDMMGRQGVVDEQKKFVLAMNKELADKMIKAIRSIK